MNFTIRLIFLIGFIIISPLILLMLLIIYFEDGAPVIFSQKRLGKNKKIIKLIKIRTMKKSTPNLGTHEIKESSYLKSGKFLRVTKIDELPQIINFVKGDMNIVGPRPGLPNQHELTRCRDKLQVYSIKPGITGLSQVLGFDMSNPNMLSKIDSLYIRNKSIKLDMNIFIATFLPFLRKKLHDKFKQEIYNFEKTDI